MLFDHIDPLYHEQSSQIFQIFRAAKDSVRGSSEGVGLLTLAFADEDEDDENLALTADINGMPKDTLLSKCSDIADRLKSRCAGLLEVSGTPSKKPARDESRFLTPDSAQLPGAPRDMAASTSPPGSRLRPQ
jgi:hypothetical protein